MSKRSISGVAFVVVLTALAACGGSESASTSLPDSVADQASAAEVGSVAESDETESLPDKCVAWNTMMRQQPAGQLSDEQLSVEFSAFADAVDDATVSFPSDQADVLQEYSAGLRAFAGNPSSQDAMDTMADLTGPMAQLTGEIANECGLDTVNDI